MSINLDLLDIRAFLAVFDLASFGEAAELLNLSQPALSRRIQALEIRLGTALFERSTRHVTPTPSGRKLEPIARRVLDEFDYSILTVSDIGTRQSGHISIASIPSVAVRFLPAVMQKFNVHYPLIRLRIQDLPPEAGLESVKNGEVEFGINVIGSVESGLIFTPLLDDPYVLAC